MKNKLMLVILILSIMLNLSACEQKVDAETVSGYGFVEVCTQSFGGRNVRIIYEKTTKVMYIFAVDTAIQPMYNADGTLMIYEE